MNRAKAPLTGTSGPVVAAVTPPQTAAQSRDQTRDQIARRYYQKGLGLSAGGAARENFSEAAKWFRRASDLGHPGAQFMLGTAYYVGRGVARDQAKGVRWMTIAADQGHARAQYNVGDAYINGRGVKKNMAWGARWFGKAAAQGHTRAQFSYAVAAATGLGLPVDNGLSWKWLKIAEDGGHKQAGQVRAKIETRMTPEEISRASALATKWKVGRQNVFADQSTVRFVQFALTRIGFSPGAVDGIAGPQTAAAVASFARGVGLPTRGAITPELVRLLRARSS